MQRILLLIIGLMIIKPSWADSLDMNFHGHAFRATYATYVGRKAVADFGALFLREKVGKENDTLLHAGVNFIFQNLRFGVRAIYVTPANYDLLSLGFGLQGRFALTRRVGIGGHFYYAPDVTSAMDSEGYHEFGARLDFKANKDVYLYIGYRNLKVKILSVTNKVELDDDVHIGAKLYF